MDEEALTASLTRTRTLRSPEGTPILHQGGTLCPLVGSRIQGLRPVPKRKPNKNKGLSVPMKMGTHLTPANVPISCVWRGYCIRRGSKLPAPRSFDKGAPGNLQTWCSGYENKICSMFMHRNLPFFMKERPKMAMFWSKIEVFGFIYTVQDPLPPILRVLNAREQLPEAHRPRKPHLQHP